MVLYCTVQYSTRPQVRTKEFPCPRGSATLTLPTLHCGAGIFLSAHTLWPMSLRNGGSFDWYEIIYDVIFEMRGYRILFIANEAWRGKWREKKKTAPHLKARYDYDYGLTLYFECSTMGKLTVHPFHSIRWNSYTWVHHGRGGAIGFIPPNDVE